MGLKCPIAHFVNYSSEFLWYRLNTPCRIEQTIFLIRDIMNSEYNTLTYRQVVEYHEELRSVIYERVEKT